MKEMVAIGHSQNEQVQQVVNVVEELLLEH
jgi:hypothetical protein